MAGKYGFRIGTFNIFPSFGVTMLMITAMGVLPYYVKYGMSGEQPRALDDFERYKQQQSYWETGNAFLQTQLAKRNAGREALEAEWREKHKALQ